MERLFLYPQMKHGICPLSIVPVRADASDASEMVTQLLFGDLYAVLESRKKWLRIKMSFDGYEGWIDAKQAFEISKSEAEKLEQLEPSVLLDTVQMISLGTSAQPQLIVQGSCFYHFANGHFVFNQTEVECKGEVVFGKTEKQNLLDLAFSYLNAPYLWGGRTPFGIDCSGFSQMVYKLGGYKLPRDAKDQAELGEALSFIEEAEPGDLAFFDNEEGKIVHVGILLANNYIIHASGKVRIDRLDQHGIYNNEARTHTHRLRVIKKIF